MTELCQQERPTGNWYQGLDGVRAVAVILVFCTHYFGYRIRFTGWTGVNIFFVLSGFLITGVLFDNREEPFRFRNFYIRRTLRIFPLFYFAWLLVLVAGFFLHAYWYPIQILWPLYLGNYVRFIVGSESLDTIATLRPPHLPLVIGHFWSLAVEEQFYLLWPLVVFHVRQRKLLIRICIAAVLLVPVLRVVLWATVSKNLQSIMLMDMLTPTQCDAFLLGGLMALWMRGEEKDKLLRNSGKIFVVSFALLAAAYLLNNGPHLRDMLPNSGWMSTYGFTLVDFSAAGLILCALRTRSLTYRLTTSWPLRTIGRYSYGIYVYHALLIKVLQYYVWPADHNWPPRVYLVHAFLSILLYFLIVVAVSACSYHFLELPFLKLKDRFAVRHKNPYNQTKIPAVQSEQ
jgi:peptidoglycan/LPS O-acetylase OafA/YrhL